LQPFVATSKTPGALDGKFARLAGKLLIYEPLALRLRDLWQGRLNYDNTKSNFLIIQSDQTTLIKKEISFEKALWTSISDGDTFECKLPMELSEFSTIEKRRRTRARSQLWNVWMPEHAHICEDWSEERWDIVRRSKERERLIRDKEGFRNLDDESELPLEQQSFHRYFQTVTRRMHTYVPPDRATDFNPPRWAPDIVAGAINLQIPMPKNNEYIKIDTSPPTANTRPVKVTDVFVSSWKEVSNGCVGVVCVVKGWGLIRKMMGRGNSSLINRY